MFTFTSPLIRHLNEFGNDVYLNIYSFVKYLHSFIKFFMLTLYKNF